MKRYIAVAGTIGAGKTSLVTWLAKRYRITPYFEPNDTNPYLEDFYRDMPRWALASQCYFLSHKLELHQKLDSEKAPFILDRTIYEDAEIFARNLYDQKIMTKRDWEVYERLYRGICAMLKPPDLLVAVTCSLAATKKRIQRRGRAMEQSVPDAYLRRLHRRYTAWFDAYDLSPKVWIDTTKMDYVEDLVDLIELQSTLDRALS